MKRPVRSVVVAGAGVLGVEVAEQVRLLEKQVTMVSIHSTIMADLVLFCIGVTPNTALAKTAGLHVNRGIVVNQFLQTSHPDIFAAGDVAEHPGGTITFLWHAAEYQGMVAAENSLGGIVPYEHPAFRLKCEVFGQYFFSINKPPDSERASFTVIENTENAIYQCFYYREDLLHSVIMVNDKARAKLYEKAVRERWERKRVEEVLMDHAMTQQECLRERKRA